MHQPTYIATYQNNIMLIEPTAKAITAESIVQAIQAHPHFKSLNWVQQECITSHVSVKWVLLACNCMCIDSDRTLAGLHNHASICDDFKTIYKDILQELV